MSKRTSKHLPSRIGTVLLFCSMGILNLAHAGPVIDQTGNLLVNGSLENGSLDPVVGHNVPSAADNWYQWSNTGSTVTTELITESEMQTNFGVGVIDGSRALRITTTGADGTGSDGGYTLSGLFGQPGWDTSATMTFSGWIYTISGNAGLWLGSNATGFSYTANSIVGGWEFISVTRSGSPNINDEPLLYSTTTAADFIIDSIWLNTGDESAHPGAPASVPEPGSLILLVSGLLGLRRLERLGRNRETLRTT